MNFGSLSFYFDNAVTVSRTTHNTSLRRASVLSHRVVHTLVLPVLHYSCRATLRCWQFDAQRKFVRGCQMLFTSLLPNAPISYCQTTPKFQTLRAVAHLQLHLRGRTLTESMIHRFATHRNRKVFIFIASAACTVTRCLCVCLSVCLCVCHKSVFTYQANKAARQSRDSSFLVPNGLVKFHRGHSSPSRGAKCMWGKKKLRFSTK